MQNLQWALDYLLNSLHSELPISTKPMSPRRVPGHGNGSSAPNRIDPRGRIRELSTAANLTISSFSIPHHEVIRKKTTILRCVLYIVPPATKPIPEVPLPLRPVA